MSPLFRQIFPPRCLACREILVCGDWLCGPCERIFPDLPSAHCPRCALPFPSPHTGAHICGECLQEEGSGSLGRVWALGLYRGVLAKIVTRLKYGREEALAFRLGRELAKKLTVGMADLVVPVPLHVRRLRQRGFNQSAWLARSLAKEIRVPYAPTLLFKKDKTVPQTGLSKEERWTNVRNSFTVRGDKVVGKKILLVDDVYTTGATLASCARVLKKAGAEEINAIVVARTA